MTAKEGSDPPQLPAPIMFAGAKNEFDGLSRLAAPWQGADSDAEDGGAEHSASMEPLTVAELTQAVQDGSGASSETEEGEPGENQTLLRLRFEIPIHDVATACRSLVEAHRPQHGVAVDGDNQLLMIMPPGVSWSSVVRTVRQVEPMLGQGITAGIAEFSDGQDSLARAVDLSLMGVIRAAAAGQPACMLDLQTLLAEEERMREEALVAEALLQALRSGTGLRLVYQPKYDPESRVIVGAEALLRFECDHLGALGPSEFLPIAERAGLRSQVERWVLDEGIAAVAEWKAEGVLDFPVSMNVAPTDFFSELFVEELKQWIEVFEADPALLCLELPERGLQNRDLETIHSRLEEVRALGVSVALDDVGESDAQLAGIRGLEIDELKVHRSLVLEMAYSESASAVVRGILRLAGALDIETVAAGVETESQLAQLREFGCGAVQGFLLSRPLESSAFGELLRSVHSAEA